MADNSFGKVNKFGIVEDTGYFQAIGLAYKKQIGPDSGIFGKTWAGVKSPVYGTVNYACHHPYKTAAVFLAIAAVTSLTAAYFLSPTYAAFVGGAVTKAAALVSPAITAVSTFAAAHPLVASLIIVAGVAALIAAPVYIWLNSSKAGQIEKACELLKDKDPASKIDELKEVFGISQGKTASAPS